MRIIRTSTRTVKVKQNGRSGDFTSANFIYGCNGTCQYCYLKRYNDSKIYIYDEKSVEKIIRNVFTYGDDQLWPKIPNQVHDKLYLVDIGNACDVCLQYVYTDWQSIVERIVSHGRLGVTFATTYPNTNFDRWSNELLHYHHEYGYQSRVRVTLMPQGYSAIVEPNGERIADRIAAIEHLRDKGWQVHYSFAPIIVADGWEKHYAKLLSSLPDEGAAECIFLTTTPKQQNIPLLYPKSILEWKVSQRGTEVQRYQYQLKRDFIKTFRELMAEHLPNVKIRYIF